MPKGVPAQPPSTVDGGGLPESPPAGAVGATGCAGVSGALVGAGAVAAGAGAGAGTGVAAGTDAAAVTLFGADLVVPGLVRP